MQVFQGYSLQQDPEAAVAEATADMPNDLDMLLIFISTAQPSEEVIRGLVERFPTTQIAGCTTAGGHLSGQHLDGALVLSGLITPEIKWATELIEDLGSFDEERAQVASHGLFRQLSAQGSEIDREHTFGMLFIDGLSKKEEGVAALLADALDGIPLVGGSAGDDLHFEETKVFAGSRARTNAAVVLLGQSSTPFRILKHQHFQVTPQSLVITKADVSERRVYEMDGYPAAEAYAQALGVERGELTDARTFLNPLTFSCNGQIYVRSIQKLHDDDSISFYCGIEEGMVLEVGGHTDQVTALDNDLAATLGDQTSELLIVCNCILRSLEATQNNKHQELGQLLNRISRHSIGFDTYGEQLNGLHINQTLVGIALSGAIEEAAQ